MAECKHEHWHVYDDNTPGFGTCEDCHKQVGLAVLFEALRKQIQDALDNAKSLAQNQIKHN